MLHEEKSMLHQRKLSDFSERQQGDYMTLRNILYSLEGLFFGYG